MITFTVLYIMWILYLAVMNLKRARDDGKLSKPAYYLGLPLLYGGLAIDILCNLTLMTLIMLELPRELTVSSRLSRHSHDSSGYRKKIAVWIGTNLLDAFDPSGKHIK